MTPLVSVIMPAYDAAQFIQEAIQSVLDQDHRNLELIVVNDGSHDETEEIIQSFSDTRVKYTFQKNEGVSAARNKGINLMKGSYFCFLDADDIMPENSISARLKIFQQNEEIEFVVGGQVEMNETLSVTYSKRFPTYEGNPRRRLARIDPSCFINCGTWLIKKQDNKNYSFPLNWTHSEDLAFFFSISQSGLMKVSSTPAQIYRRLPDSAMSNLEKLEDGYWKYLSVVREALDVPKSDKWYLNIRVIRIMSLSYWAGGQYLNAIRVLTKLFR